MEAVKWVLTIVLFAVACWLIGCGVELNPVVIHYEPTTTVTTTTIGPPSTAGPDPWVP